MTILEKMLGNCESYGLKPTENIEKVAKAKSRMFGEEAWRRCPCDGENEKRYCVSEATLNATASAIAAAMPKPSEPR